MPVIHTGSYRIPLEAGKGLGQINAEREQYTRGVEQAKLDMQKKKIADDQMMRKLARIDADEKETRRQQEWDAIAKKAKEAAEESKRRWEEEQRTKGEMTDYQEQIIEAKKRAEQERIDKIKRNEDMLRRVSLGESTQPTVTDERQRIEEGIKSGDIQVEPKGYPESVATSEEPTPVQKSLQDQYYEGLKKQIIPIDANFKKRLRMKAISEENKPNRSAKQNEYAITSYYNTELKKAEKEYQDDVNAYNKAMLEKKQKEIKADKPREFTPIQKQKIKAVKANLKRSKSINKWGETKTIASLDEALDYIISEKLSPELFTKELEKFARSEYNKLRASGVSAEEARRRLGL